MFGRAGRVRAVAGIVAGRWTATGAAPRCAAAVAPVAPRVLCGPSSSARELSSRPLAAVAAAPLEWTGRARVSTLPLMLGRAGARGFATKVASDITKLRNIGISAHIDSGKTTLTERILFYTGRINAMHEVKGKDGVGATMDHMELEREKGITIQSAATYCSWGDNFINIIDTPGHVDFTIEVERALRVLDSAVLVLCGVAGVQSQSITVDRQMKRYGVPRLAFINKLDRQGANPHKVIKDLHTKLKLNAAPVQLPIGLEDNLIGLIDLVRQKALIFEGEHGEVIVEKDIPADRRAEVDAARHHLLERLAEVDPEMEDAFFSETIPEEAALKAAIRRATSARKFVPVFMGSAFKNKGVQLLLNGVVDYLPNPNEVTNVALDRAHDEAEVTLQPDPAKPLVALAFKLEESRFGQLTYMRVYQGRIRKGDFFYNVDRKEKVKIPRLVKMHASDMEDVDELVAGEIGAVFGVDCASGETFTDGSVQYAMSRMYCPEPVISYSIKPAKSASSDKFSKALNRFQREDPTFRVHVDAESNETIISGMGELHLEIYVERMKREYQVEVVTGEPRVNYRETIGQRAEFNYLHRKQSGGAGQYGRVIGYLEPLPEGHPEKFVFENAVVGNNIAPEYMTAVKKGFEEGAIQGMLTGHPVEGVKCVVTDGQDHPVDSSEIAFKLAAKGAFRQGFELAKPTILEPIMSVEITVPVEFQGVAIGLVNKRGGQLYNQEATDMTVTLEATVPLSRMFGFSTDLRSSTQGKGEFTMEYKEHAPVTGDVQKKLIKDFQDQLAKKNK